MCAAALLVAVASDGARAACFTDLRASASFDALLAQAMSTVNRAVDDPALALTPVGPATEAPERLDGVPVSSVFSDRTSGHVAQVVPGCREILVSGTDFLAAFSTLAEDDVLVTGREREMLVLLLLHELGHIEAGHHGAFLPPDAAALSNLDVTDSKAREREADAFVAQVLGRQVVGIDAGTADTDALSSVIFLSSLSLALSMQTSTERFGCEVLGCAEVFWDQGRTHDNLRLRLLTLSHAISPTPVSARLLEDFEAQRAADAPGTMWIIRPDGTRERLETGSEEFQVFEELLPAPLATDPVVPGDANDGR